MEECVEGLPRFGRDLASGGVDDVVATNLNRVADAEALKSFDRFAGLNIISWELVDEVAPTKRMGAHLEALRHLWPSHQRKLTDVVPRIDTDRDREAKRRNRH